MPADETNLFVQQVSDRQLDKIRLFSPEKLLRLSEWVTAHSKSLTEKFSCVPEDELGEHRKTNDTKAFTIKRSARKRRTDETPDQADSTVSGQNALHNQPARRPDEE